MALRDRDVHAIAGGQQGPILNDFAGPQYICLLDRENVVHDIRQQLKCRTNRLAFADGGIPMQDLLQHFGVGNEALSRYDATKKRKPAALAL